MSIAPKKRYGQHFLTSPAIVERIIAAAELTSGDTVLEIGPGRGVLTGLLAERAGRLVAVEVDRQLARALRESFRDDPRVAVVEQDFLQADIDALLPGRFTVVANLPYYITVPIIERLLERKGRIDRIIVMVQREMAARMAAGPGSGDYGSLSVFIQYHVAVDKLFDVPPGAFFPPPKVTSSVIRLIPRTPPFDPEEAPGFFDFVKRLFQTRRKMLRATLRNLGYTAIDDAGLKAGVDLTRRPETLDMQELFRLHQACCSRDK
ncbi:MAG: 16S rRNA (adenine(1518)-N(6)/adenine(1519)-N(6))-dimethyltransferase RsmA [Xanthomonadales bacterium]|nr:16S rRNA (adenine(1518)-N(6)/adenine(1519)-N(6))-dimethyltransferase RsmA [Xanthomonadales bacterium]